MFKTFKKVLTLFNIMEELQNRLKLFLESININMQTFERQCNIAQGLGSRLSPKSYATTFKRIESAFPQLNIDWLKSGDGDMLNYPIQQVVNTQNAHHFTQSGDVMAAADGTLSELIREFSETRKAFNDTILANNKTIDRLLALIEKLTSS